MYRLKLFCWNAQDEPVQLGLHLNLTAQTAFRANIEGEVEHILFHGSRGTRFGTPAFIDENVAGGARARASALGIDACDIV